MTSIEITNMQTFLRLTRTSVTDWDTQYNCIPAPSLVELFNYLFSSLPVVQGVPVKLRRYRYTNIFKLAGTPGTVAILLSSLLLLLD